MTTPLLEEAKTRYHNAPMSVSFVKSFSHAGAELQEICHRAAAQSGWWKNEAGADVRDWPEEILKLWIGTKHALIHTETSEATEGFRKDLPDDKLPHRSGHEVELADTVIRCFDLAGGLGLNLGDAIVEKLAYNLTRADHKPENRALENGKKF